MWGVSIQILPLKQHYCDKVKKCIRLNQLYIIRTLKINPYSQDSQAPLKRCCDFGEVPLKQDGATSLIFIPWTWTSSYCLCIWNKDLWMERSQQIRPHHWRVLHIRHSYTLPTLTQVEDTTVAPHGEFYLFSCNSLARISYLESNSLVWKADKRQCKKYLK